MPAGWWQDVTARRSRSDEELGTMWRLSRRGRDQAATRDALVRRKGGAMLDRIRQQVKGALCVRLDQLELRKVILVGLDVVAVLHLVKAGGSGADSAGYPLYDPGRKEPRPRRAHRRGRGD